MLTRFQQARALEFATEAEIDAICARGRNHIIGDDDDDFIVIPLSHESEVFECDGVECRWYEPESGAAEPWWLSGNSDDL